MWAPSWRVFSDFPAISYTTASEFAVHYLKAENSMSPFGQYLPVEAIVGSSPDFLTTHNHVIFYHPPLGGIQDTVNMILSRLLSVAGSYTRLSKVTFVTGAGLTRAVIQQKI